MAKTISYRIRLHGLYLQSVQANSDYCATGHARNMGRLHTLSEYRTTWGPEPCAFEPLTAAANVKIIMEEFRWESREPEPIEVIPVPPSEEGGPS